MINTVMKRVTSLVRLPGSNSRSSASDGSDLSSIVEQALARAWAVAAACCALPFRFFR